MGVVEVDSAPVVPRRCKVTGTRELDLPPALCTSVIHSAASSLQEPLHSVFMPAPYTLRNNLRWGPRHPCSLWRPGPLTAALGSQVRNRALMFSVCLRATGGEFPYEEAAVPRDPHPREPGHRQAPCVLWETRGERKEAPDTLPAGAEISIFIT